MERAVHDDIVAMLPVCDQLLAWHRGVTALTLTEALADGLLGDQVATNFTTEFDAARGAVARHIGLVAHPEAQ